MLIRGILYLEMFKKNIIVLFMLDFIFNLLYDNKAIKGFDF